MNAEKIIAGRYAIISELAAGGMGVTYRAWDKVLARPVVIKMPNQFCRDSAVLLARFSREVELMRRYTHSSIVPVIGAGSFGDRSYMAMPFLPGGSLADRQRGGRFGNPRPKPPEALFLWLPAIAEALDFLHKNGVVHRDVKPSNIFFDAYFGARLGDLGLAKNSDLMGAGDLTESDAGLGTILYTPPEQLARSKSVDARADQYSLAVTVFEYLTGQVPFKGAEKHVIFEIMEDDPPDLASVVPDLPELLCVSVRRAMARSPDERFPSCKDFVEGVCRELRKPPILKDVARMLCPSPSCQRIIKLRPSAAGRTGKCPKCKIPMTAAPDLSAFWLVSENPAEIKVEDIVDLPEVIYPNDRISEHESLFERSDFSGVLSKVLVDNSVSRPTGSPKANSPKAYLNGRVSQAQKSKLTTATISYTIWTLFFAAGALFSLFLHDAFTRDSRIEFAVAAKEEDEFFEGALPKEEDEFFEGALPYALKLSKPELVVTGLPRDFGWSPRTLRIKIRSGEGESCLITILLNGEILRIGDQKYEDKKISDKGTMIPVENVTLFDKIEIQVRTDPTNPESKSGSKSCDFAYFLE